MRKIKSLAALLVLFALALTSCQKQDETTNSEDADVVVDFLKMSSADTTSSTCSKDSLDSTHRRHHVRNITEIDIATLPTTISTYINTNYAGATIQKAGVDSLGRYFIQIMKSDSTYIGLLFDASGNFVRELLRKKHDDRGTTIDPSALPASVSTYISTNYAGVTIRRAILESDGTYRVIIILADNSYLGLSFDASGNFVNAMTVTDHKGKKRGHRR